MKYHDLCDKMLKLCDKFDSEYNVLFNAEKYQLPHYPVRGGKEINGIYHENIYIKCVKDSLHLNWSYYWSECEV